ncbi:MAG TPA: MBL fold metallo-hydrolase [Bacillales bacterium]|nr:MBL fold metallo-hydrolase [Bacillales bacterium]
MQIQLIRHATLWVEYQGKSILVDPMFGAAEEYPPIQNATNDRRNPLVPLPVSIEKINEPDLIIVTHLHNDHWDPEAIKSLPKETLIFCQPGDKETIHQSGFTNVTEVASSVQLSNITFDRTDGEHGTGDIGKKMGQVSGFILRANDEPTLYIAGDTIYCDKVTEALDEYQPDYTVVNAGGARFAKGDPITMTPEDVVSVCRHSPKTKVVAVHMDTINHCLDTRDDLRARLEEEKLSTRVSVPEDGECLSNE